MKIKIMPSWSGRRLFATQKIIGLGYEHHKADKNFWAKGHSNQYQMKDNETWHFLIVWLLFVKLYFRWSQFK